MGLLENPWFPKIYLNFRVDENKYKNKVYNDLNIDILK